MAVECQAHQMVFPFVGFSNHDGTVASVPVPKIPHVSFSILNGLFIGSLPSWGPGIKPTLGPSSIPFIGRTTDAGFIVPHVPIPPTNTAVGMTIAFGSSIAIFGSSSVKMKVWNLIFQSTDADVACCVIPFVPISLNLACNDLLPASIPLPFDVVISPSNVLVGVTWADVVAALIDVALEVGLAVVGAGIGAGVKKGAKSAKGVKGASNAAEAAGREAAEAGTEKAAKEAAQEAADEAAQRAARETADAAAEKAAKEAAQATADEAAQRAAREAADAAAEKAAKEAAQATADEAAQRAAREAADAAAEKAAKEAAQATADEAAQRAAHEAAEAAQKQAQKAAAEQAADAAVEKAVMTGADEAATRAAKEAAQQAAQETADAAAQRAAKEAAQATADEAAQRAARETADAAAEKAAKDAAQATADEAAQRAAREAADAAAEKAAKDAAQATADEAAQRAAREAADAAAEKAAKEAAQATADEAAQRAAREAADAAAEKAAKDAAQEAADEAAEEAKKAADNLELGSNIAANLIKGNAYNAFKFFLGPGGKWQSGDWAVDGKDRTGTLKHPKVTITSTAPDPTSSSPIPVTVTFNKITVNHAWGDDETLNEIKNFKDSNDDIPVSGASRSNFSGSGKVFTFNLQPSGPGKIKVDVPAGVAYYKDRNDLRYPNLAADQFKITFNRPTVTITSTEAGSTSNAPIPVTVTFSGNVTGFSASDLTTGNATISKFSGSGNTYTFDLIPTTPGVLTVDIAQDVTDSGNEAATQFSITFQRPTVSISSTAPDPTNTSPIPVSVTFGGNVTGFTSADLTLSANATVSTFAGSGNQYTFDLVPTASQDGVAVTVDIAQDVTDAGNEAASQFSRTYDDVPPKYSALIPLLKQWYQRRVLMQWACQVSS